MFNLFTNSLIAFIIYTALASLFCTNPISDQSSDLCRRNNETIEYFKPLYYENVHPYVLQSQSYIEPYTQPYVKHLQPVYEYSKPHVETLKYKSKKIVKTQLKPRLEIQVNRLNNKLQPHIARGQLIADNYYSKYLHPINESDHVKNFKIHYDKFSSYSNSQLQTIKPYLMATTNVILKYLKVIFNNVWNYTKFHFPVIKKVTIKYFKRFLAECLTIINFISMEISKLLLKIYIRFGLNEKFVNVENLHNLKVKYINPLTDTLSEWVIKQRENVSKLK